MQQNIFYFIAGGFFLGVLFSSFVDIQFSFLMFLGIISLAVFAFLFIKNFREKAKLRIPIFILISFLCFCLGVFRFDFLENRFSNNPLDGFEGRKVSVLVVVVDEPSRKGDNLSTRVKVYSIKEGENIKNISPRFIQIKVPFYKNLFYGDEVVISGKLTKIKNFNVKDGPKFDYVSYLKIYGVSYEISFPEVEIISHSKGNFLIASALSLKKKFISNIEDNFGEPDASLVSGMVISGKGSMEKNLQNDFIKAGIIHIVVLSGYNIALVVSFLLYIFSFAGRRIKFFIVLFGVSVFVIISGASAPVLRSAIMAVVVLFLKFHGRQMEAFRVLLFAAFVMVVFNPYLLVFDTSFQLSFLAVFAVIYVTPILKNKLSFITSKWKFREIIGDTLGTQIFLLPFLVYKMGLISLVALPVNILVLPVVPFMMFIGFIVGGLGFIPYITFPFAVLAHFLIKFILFVVKVFVSIPFSTISISHLPNLLVLIFYFLIFLYIYYLKVFRERV